MVYGPRDRLKVKKQLKEGQVELLDKKIGDAGARAVTEGLGRKDVQVRSVSLQHCKIGDDGARALADALHVAGALTELNLNSNRVGDDGARALADSLRVNEALTSLDLAVNDIGDEGTRALADALRVNGTLANLRLNHNDKITPSLREQTVALAADVDGRRARLLAANVGASSVSGATRKADDEDKAKSSSSSSYNSEDEKAPAAEEPAKPGKSSSEASAVEPPSEHSSAHVSVSATTVPVSAEAGVMTAASAPVTSRVMDSLEDGRMRSPLAGLFPPDMPVAATLLEALTPVGRSGLAPKNLQQCIRISETHIKSQHALPNCSSSISALSLVEGAAIALYSMENTPKDQSVYFMVNAALRSDDREGMKPWVPYVWLLCHALRKLPVPEEPVVYRGVRLPLADGKELAAEFVTEGAEFCLSAFSSTTASLGTLNSPAFLGPEGDRVAWVLNIDTDMARDIKPFSLIQGEDEILLMPNCRFRVKSAFRSNDGLLMVQARAVETLDAILQVEVDEQW
jgi:NAD:arginine ADP-ribosyltransferase/Leucine Rich repeat